MKLIVCVFALVTVSNIVFAEWRLVRTSVFRAQNAQQVKQLLKIEDSRRSRAEKNIFKPIAERIIRNELVERLAGAGNGALQQINITVRVRRWLGAHSCSTDNDSRLMSIEEEGSLRFAGGSNPSWESQGLENQDPCRGTSN